MQRLFGYYHGGSGAAVRLLAASDPGTFGDLDLRSFAAADLLMALSHE
ncbi:MAG TPA: hypothetical protein VFR23_00190 [Jiangellaceae bacterium]|nr:hypothetical protein [Jiangellaceae bacterium]